MLFDGPPPEKLAQHTGFLLTWAGHRQGRRMIAALEPLGLHPRHFGVLNLIDAEPGVTQQELVTGSSIDPSSMVAVVDELEEAGLAERRSHPTDRRKRAVYLTARGR